jgi:hypothetical protein
MEFQKLNNILLINPTRYSITIKELLERPFIRTDRGFEYQNKMTDEELKEEYEQMLMMVMEREGRLNVQDVAEKYIDRHILYRLFQLAVEQKEMDITFGNL